MANHICFTVEDRSYFSLLKKEIHSIVTKAGFSENKVGEIDIVVAELVSNLVKHGSGGKLLVKLVQQDGIDGIELISIDNGEGMADVSKMVVDGMSTTNTLGHGLGAIKRMSDVFQVYSQKDWGTVVLSRIFEEELPYKKKRHEIRTVVVAKPGEIDCGDGFHCSMNETHVRIFLGDGLGHGKEASIAVNTAIEAFKICSEETAAETIRVIHNAVRKTRGLVATIAIYDLKQKTWSICGVGNIATRLLNGIETKNCMAYNGIIGYNMPTTMKDHEVPADNGQVLFLCSDGIKTRWDHIKYPAILKYDLSVFASVIFKDFARFTDDMSLAAIKLNF
jgi:anti-sigma regulatory factor (Ser/Thr protein kinase)